MATIKVITHALPRGPRQRDTAARRAALSDEIQSQKAGLALEIGGLTRRLVELAAQRGEIAPAEYDTQRRYLKRQLRTLKGAFASYGDGGG